MMLLPVIILLAGVICGRFVFPIEITNILDLVTTIALGVVVFCAGVDIGCKKSVFHNLKQYKAKVLAVPIGSIAGSIAGGLLAGGILRMPINESAAISMGFGYYSISVGLFNELGAGHLAALAFLANNLRETLSLIFIPLIARYIHNLSAVSAGGCTTMDVTLPVIARSTDEETTMIAMLNGVILSILVPLLIPLAYRIF